MRKIFKTETILLTLIILVVISFFIAVNPHEHFQLATITQNEEFAQPSTNNPGEPWKEQSAHSFQAFSIGYSLMKEDERENYFLSLSGYRMKPNTSFKTKNGKWFVSSPVWDRIIGDTVAEGHEIIKPSPVRFEKNVFSLSEKGAVLLPVSRSSYQSTRILLWFMVVLFALLNIWAFVIIPAGIIIRLARGNSFNSRNSRGVFIIGIVMIVGWLLPLLISMASRIIFGNSIPSEMNYNWLENVLQNKGWLLAGLIMLLIAKAFEQGYQSEQLTP
jgi:hypothetical protein